MCLCFQAEDGIRDLVRSRGLGDVYKRQQHGLPRIATVQNVYNLISRGLENALDETLHRLDAVSYTHLTLPTSDLV